MAIIKNKTSEDNNKDKEEEEEINGIIKVNNKWQQSNNQSRDNMLIK